MSEPSTSGSGAFSFPPFFSFPPYFTIQPVKETRERQLELWKDLILAYCKHHRIFLVNVDDDSNPIFRNDKIQRKLNREGKLEVLSYLVKSGSAEAISKFPDAPKSKSAPPASLYLIWWRPAESWADRIFQWANDYGHRDSVVTFHEIKEGVRELGPNCPPAALLRMLRALEDQGKASVFGAEEGVAEEDHGVKFA